MQSHRLRELAPDAHIVMKTNSGEKDLDLKLLSQECCALLSSANTIVTLDAPISATIVTIDAN